MNLILLGFNLFIPGKAYFNFFHSCMLRVVCLFTSHRFITCAIRHNLAYPLDGGRIYAASLILFLKLGPLKAAIVTAVTAMLLSAAMVAYAVISFLMDIGGSGLLLGLIGIFIFSNSYDLFASARRNDLGDHPIFGRQCYRGTGESTGESGEGRSQEVLAQSDSAVIT